MVTSIQNKAILVELKIGSYGGEHRSADAEQAARVAFSLNGDDTVRSTIQIVDKRYLSKPQAAAREVRQVVKRFCLRFGKQNLLPTALFQDFHDALRKAKQKLQIEVNILKGELPMAELDAQTRLGSLWNPKLFPTVQQIDDAFYVDIKEMPVGDADSWQPELHPDAIRVLRDSFNNMLEERTLEAVMEATDRLYDRVKQIATTLKQEDKIFRDSLIGNLMEITKLMPAFNLTNDPKLTAIVDQAKALLIEPDLLRKDPQTRAEAAQIADEIASKMEGLWGTQSQSS